MGRKASPWSQTTRKVSPTTPHQKTDKDGDLVLWVGKELPSPTKEYLVCSSAMRRASPVWKKMLFGGFRESKPAEGDWVVALPDDDPDTLRILLDVIHANFAGSYLQLDVVGIYNHVILMDKYDMLRFMQPSEDVWLEVAKGAAESSAGYPRCMAAYIALQVSAESTAYRMVRGISKYARAEKDGNYKSLEPTFLTALIL